MSQITDITPQVKDKLRVNIYLDNRFACGLTLETVMKHRLKKGMEVTKEELERMQSDSEKSVALDKALSYIAPAMRSEKEIRDYLKKKGYLPAVCDEVVEKMKSYGYIDDEIYGKMLTESLAKNKGKRYIENKLREKGVGEEETFSALSSLKEEDEISSAARVLEKYLRNKEITKETLYKALRYLLGKGYSYDAAKSALTKWGETEED